jgi:exonuclease SbcC
MEIYHQDLAANLADKLQPNKACLVCGSKDHPNPATPKKGEPSRADLDVAISEVDGAKGDLDSAILAVKTQLAMIGASSKQLPNDSSIEAVVKKLGVALSKLEEVNSKLLIHNDQKLELDKANQAIKATKTLIASGAKELEAAKSAVDATKGSVKVLTKALDGKSQSGLENQLSKIQTKADELESLAPKFAALKSSIVNAQAIVAANKEASLNVIDDLEGLRLEVSQMQEALNEIRDQQTRVSDQHKSVTKIQESFSALLAKNEKAQQAEEQWANLESYTSGTSGRKIDLATFYLGYRLKQVLGAANHRLYAMTDGRYALVHDESVSAAHGASRRIRNFFHDVMSDARG